MEMSFLCVIVVQIPEPVILLIVPRNAKYVSSTGGILAGTDSKVPHPDKRVLTTRKDSSSWMLKAGYR